MTKPGNTYIRKLKRKLVGSSKKKKKYILMLNELITNKVEDNPNLSFEDLCAVLGTPEEKAAEFINEMDPKEIQKHTVNKRIALITAIIIVAAFIAGMTYLVIDGHIGNHGHMVTYIEDVPEEIQNDIPEGAIITDVEGF